MIVKMEYRAKEAIMENVGKLKGKTNPTTELPLFVGEQAPEGITEMRKNISARLKVLQKDNDTRPPHLRQEIKVIGDNISIDGQIQEVEVIPPKPLDLFLNPTQQEKVDQINETISETEPSEMLKSHFIGLATEVHSIKEVNLAYKAVAQRFPSAGHIMVAYGLKDSSSGKVKIGHCDDREYGGGLAIRKMMAENSIRDMAMFVVRLYGGVHLGGNRFKTISSVAKQAVDKYKD